MYSLVLKGNANEIVKELHDIVMDLGMSINFADHGSINCGNTVILTRAYEKYFMRSKSYVTLNLTIANCGDDIVYVNALSSGGGNGVFNISWGAEGSFINQFINAVGKLNCEIVSGD